MTTIVPLLSYFKGSWGFGKEPYRHADVLLVILVYLVPVLIIFAGLLRALLAPLVRAIWPTTVPAAERHLLACSSVVSGAAGGGAISIIV